MAPYVMPWSLLHVMSTVEIYRTDGNLGAVVAVGALVVVLGAGLAWGVWKTARWAYWVLAAVNLLYFFSYIFRVFDIRSVQGSQWTSLGRSLVTLVWLAVPSV